MAAAYKYRGLTTKLAYICGLMLVTVALGGAAMLQGEPGFGAILVTAIDGMFALACLVLIVGQADVIVDNRGIVRLFRGKTLQRIEWTNVATIRVFPGNGGPGHLAVHVLPADRTVRGAHRKIWFGGRNDELAQLVTAMAHYARAHNVRVERVSAGV